jgi:hypothetical protein
MTRIPFNLYSHERKMVRLMREAINRKNGKPLLIVYRVDAGEIECTVSTPKSTEKIDLYRDDD